MVAHVFVSGFVQGVGFRRFIKHNAVKLGLTGWVKNLPARNASQRKAGGPDNRVEALFQGSTLSIEKMIAICKKGAFLSEVRDVDVIWENDLRETDCKTFEITY